MRKRVERNLGIFDVFDVLPKRDLQGVPRRVFVSDEVHFLFNLGIDAQPHAPRIVCKFELRALEPSVTWRRSVAAEVTEKPT